MITSCMFATLHVDSKKCKTPPFCSNSTLKRPSIQSSGNISWTCCNAKGLPCKFRNWIVALLSSSTSRCLLNGLSAPLLFVLAIDLLHQILELATRKGIIYKIRERGAMVRTSLYADDAAIFMASIKRDIDNLYIAHLAGPWRSDGPLHQLP